MGYRQNLYLRYWDRLFYITGDKGFTARPLFFVRGGYVLGGSSNRAGYSGFYCSSTIMSDQEAYYLSFASTNVLTQNHNITRVNGRSLRCGI